MEAKNPTKHIPVLLDEVMRVLSPKAGEHIVDATLGGGGYTVALLEKVGPEGKVIALDADEQALSRFRKRPEYALGKKNLILRRANFADLDSVLEELAIESVDAIVADLGFSSDQMEDPLRGLSFTAEGPLDMRFDQGEARTARDIVNVFSEEELAELFFRLGEEPESRRIARAIVKGRREKPLKTTRDLALLIEEVYPKGKTLRLSSGRLVLRSSRIHPATRTFQALRMTVNREQECLQKFLEAAPRRLKAGGRLALVTFHSGEDRLVKQFFRQAAKGCVCPESFPQCVCHQKPTFAVITRKPIRPGTQEKLRNPRSRSAALRVGERV